MSRHILIPTDGSRLSALRAGIPVLEHHPAPAVAQPDLTTAKRRAS